MIHLLALCGSLRRQSLNAMVLRALKRVAPDTIQIELYPSLGNLPLFNPDIENAAPSSVVQLRDKIIQSDGVIIASPEYARGVSGVMKNALDWMVGNESFVNKPVMLLNASPRAHHALDALHLTLSTMSANIIDDAYIAIQIMGTTLDEDRLVDDASIAASLGAALNKFCSEIGRVNNAQVFPI